VNGSRKKRKNKTRLKDAKRCILDADEQRQKEERLRREECHRLELLRSERIQLLEKSAGESDQAYIMSLLEDKKKLVQEEEERRVRNDAAKYRDGLRAAAVLKERVAVDMEWRWVAGKRLWISLATDGTDQSTM